MVTARASHTATLLHDGSVLVAGGVINDRLDGWVSASAERFDPASRSWTPTGDMIEPRWSHTATLMPDGSVLVTGSWINSAESRASAELYDPASGSWTATRHMRQGRGGHTATLLSDGRVMVAGGDSGYVGDTSGPLASAELFDPSTGSWTATGDMAEARSGHTATLLPDGRVLVAGGGGMPVTAELYDPTSGRWTATGSMATGRSDHTATLLADGTVLVAGGSVGGSTCCPSTSAAELYDPGTGEWTATSRMAEARDAFTATLLPDGRVLVAGDYNDESLASAELYDPNSGT